MREHYAFLTTEKNDVLVTAFFEVKSGLSWLGTASCPEAYSPEGDCPWLRDCPQSGCQKRVMLPGYAATVSLMIEKSN